VHLNQESLLSVS